MAKCVISLFLGLGEPIVIFRLTKRFELHQRFVFFMKFTLDMMYSMNS
jgi:hypothetical protein